VTNGASGLRHMVVSAARQNKYEARKFLHALR
jgi:hypothetical protein